MTLKSSAYDTPDGAPVLVIVAEGHSDVGRLIDVLSYGYARCEHAQLAAQAIRQVRRHNAGRAALRLLKAHGGPDLLQEVPADDELRAAVLRACSDPGSVVRRGDDYAEPLPRWQARAVIAKILPWLSNPAEQLVAAGKANPDD